MGKEITRKQFMIFLVVSLILFTILIVSGILLNREIGLTRETIEATGKRLVEQVSKPVPVLPRNELVFPENPTVEEIDASIRRQAEIRRQIDAYKRTTTKPSSMKGK